MFQINTHYVQNLSCRFSADALVIEVTSRPPTVLRIDSELSLFFHSSENRQAAVRQLIDSLQELLPENAYGGPTPQEKETANDD